MPRAADYRHAAQVLRARGAALSEAASAHRRLHLGEFSGPLGEIHDESIDAIATRFARAGAELRSLGDLCERRALVCDDYVTAVDRWYQLADFARLFTSFPPRPAPWIEL